MSNEYIIIGILLVLASVTMTLLLNRFYSWFQEFRGDIIAFQSAVGTIHRQEEDLQDRLIELRVIMDGGNKILQDMADINRVAATEVTEMRDTVSRLTQLLAPVTGETVPEQSMELGETDDTYDAIYRELLSNGVDAEAAKYRAAEVTLEKLMKQGELPEEYGMSL